MAQKNVVVTINQAPYGSIYYTEGLRAAVGVTSGVDENKVAVVYLGDGAYFTLLGVDRKDTDRYIGTLRKLGSRLVVEKESLKEKGIKEHEVAPDFEMVSRKEVFELINEADFVIDF